MIAWLKRLLGSDLEARVKELEKAIEHLKAIAHRH